MYNNRQHLPVSFSMNPNAATIKALHRMKQANADLSPHIDPVIAHLKTATREFTQKDLKSLSQQVEREDREWTTYSQAGFIMKLDEPYGAQSALTVKGEVGHGHGPVLTATISEAKYAGYKEKQVWSRTIELPLFTEEQFQASSERFYMDMYITACMEAMDKFKSYYKANRPKVLAKFTKRRRDEASKDFQFGKDVLEGVGCILLDSRENAREQAFVVTFNADAVADLHRNTKRFLEGVTALDDYTQEIVEKNGKWYFIVKY